MKLDQLKLKWLILTKTYGFVLFVLFSVCDENEVFTYSIISKQPTCSNPESVITEGENGMEDYEFGCICAPGFVRSGADCIRKQECGCVMDEGIYVKVSCQYFISLL